MDHDGFSFQCHRIAGADLMLLIDLDTKIDPPAKNEQGSLQSNDAVKSLAWFNSRAIAIREALNNRNELAAKKLTDRLVNEVLEQKEIDWLVPVSHIGARRYHSGRSEST